MVTPLHHTEVMTQNSFYHFRGSRWVRKSLPVGRPSSRWAKILLTIFGSRLGKLPKLGKYQKERCAEIGKQWGNVSHSDFRFRIGKGLAETKSHYFHCIVLIVPVTLSKISYPKVLIFLLGSFGAKCLIPLPCCFLLLFFWLTIFEPTRWI